MPERRKKWGHVADVLTRLNWVEIRTFDKKGAMTATLVLEGSDVEEAEDALIDLDDGNERQSAALFVHGDRLLKLLLRGQDVALQRNNQSVKALVDACTRLLEASTTRVVALERIAQNLIAENLKQAQALAEATAGELVSGGLMESLAPAIAQKLMAEGMGAPQVVAKPPAHAQPANGAKVPSGD